MAARFNASLTNSALSFTVRRASAVSVLPIGSILNMSKTSAGRTKEISPRVSGWHLRMKLFGLPEFYGF